MGKKMWQCLGLTIIMFVFMVPPALSCVGRILYIGARDTVAEKVMAETIALLINERTGTTVKIRYFDSAAQLYEGLKTTDEEKRADIVVENTEDAMIMLKLSRDPDPNREFAQVKDRYEKELDLIWLDPFGYKNAKGDIGKTISAPLVRRDVLANFPLLPRVLNKLAGALDDTTFTGLINQVLAGEKPKNVAKDFLRAKKFI